MTEHVIIESCMIGESVFKQTGWKYFGGQRVNPLPNKPFGILQEIPGLPSLKNRNPSRNRMVILQDLARFLQDLARRCIDLQDFLARSCKIAIVLQESCKITIRLARILQDNHSTCNNLAR